jgi:hypothetical protein
MLALIDTHVHIYPSYDAGTMLDTFRFNIIKYGATCGIMMLAEREGVDFFTKWANGEGVPKDEDITRSDDSSIILEKSGAPDVVVVSGRQIACSERIEVLALATREKFNDGTTISSAVSAAISANAVPVLAWGVGKWMFKRAKIVRSVIDSFKGEQLFLGDSSLRPVFWREPHAMVYAKTLGINILAGSDPLPPKFEERRVGQYGELANFSNIKFAEPLTEQISLVLRSSSLKRAGRRAGLCEFIQRMI